MAKDNSKDVKKNYEDALKAAERIAAAGKDSVKQNELLSKTFNEISTSLFNMAGSQFFKNIEKTPNDIAQSTKNIKALKDGLDQANKTLAGDFVKNSEEFFKNIKNSKHLIGETKFPEISDFFLGFKGSVEQAEFLKKKLIELNGDKGLSASMESLEKIQKNWEQITKETGKTFENFDLKKIDQLINKQKQLTKLGDMSGVFSKMPEVFEDLAANFDEHLIKKLVDYGDDVHGFLKATGEDGKKMLVVLARHQKGFEKELMQSLSTNQKKTKEIEKQISREKELTKNVIELNETYKNASRNLSMGLKKFLTEYDNTISKAQTETGIMFKQNSMEMANLTSQTAAFGLSIGETTQMMGELGDKLHTTDFGVLSKATADFSMLAGAIGVTSGEITTIAAEMMKMGNSSDQVKDAFKDTNVLAKQLGVNSKRVVQQIEKNITKMREFGFTGGVKSLQRMAVEAERLRINVDEIFNVAKRARSIEGAMEMAAELQLAGGSFSNINPMDLLSAARKGPEELGKILTQMGGDIGSFNKETGTLEFDATDVDRLGIVAEATGMSLDSLQNIMMKNSEDSRKIKFFGDKMFDFPSMSADQKKMLTSLTDIDKNGKVEFKADSATLSTLKKAGINTTDLSRLTSKQMDKVAEVQKEEAQNLEAQNKKNASLTAAIDRFQNAFMAIFAVFEPVIAWLADVIGSFAQWIGGLGPGMKTFIAALAGFALVVPILGMIFTGFLAKLATIKTAFGGMSPMGGGGNMAKNAVSNKIVDQAGGIQKGAGGIQEQRGGGFFGTLADGIKRFGEVKATDLLKFALALGIIGGALIGFTYAMSQVGGDVGLKEMGAMVASLVILGGSVVLLSYVSKSIDTKGLLTMALAMALVGSALVPFAFAAKMMNDIDWGNVMISIGLLSGVIIGLALLGALMSGPQILALAIGVGILVAVGAGLMLFSASLLVASIAFQKLSEIDWTGFSSMGNALLAVIPGLVGFAVASMAFANPLTLIGIIMMTGALVGLTAVIVPLASALGESSSGFATFASNMGLLTEAVAKFDVDKFERIATASENMASNSSNAGIGSMIGNLLGGNQSSSSGGNQTITHEIILKTPDGRELQRLIIKDNELLS